MISYEKELDIDNKLRNCAPSPEEQATQPDNPPLLYNFTATHGTTLLRRNIYQKTT